MSDRTIFWRQSTQNSLTAIRFASERELQTFIYERMDVLGLPLLPLGRQVRSVDVLALDSTGNVVVFELKNEALNRETLARGLQHMAGVNKLEVQELIGQCEVRDYRSFLDTCTKQWGQIPNQFNGNQSLILLGSSVDSNLLEAIDYLTSKSEISVGVGTIQQFADGQERFVKIDWIRPIYQNTPKMSAVDKSGNDFYVNITETNAARSWEDCLKYGFISAGGGKWYSGSLDKLQPGHRIFAYIPKVGYVGVGKVVETAVPIKDFRVEYNGAIKLLSQVPLSAPRVLEDVDNSERCEYCVRVEWQKTVPRNQAINGDNIAPSNQNATAQIKKSQVPTLCMAFGLPMSSEPAIAEKFPFMHRKASGLA